MSRVKEAGVGILFFGALVGMGALTIALTDFDFFKKKYELTTYFDEASGLQAGDNVRVMGVIRGKVNRIEFLAAPHHLAGRPEEFWVRARLRLDVPVSSFLKKDFEIRIRNANMLGGKVVDIDLGAAREKLEPGRIAAGLPGLAATDPFQEIGDFIAENRPGIDKIIDNIESFSDDMSGLTRDIRTGEGVAHDLIYDRSMAETLRGTLADTRRAAQSVERIARDAGKKKGILGHLIYDEEWPARVSSILTGTDDFIGDVKGGKGVLGQAVYNDKWSGRVSSILAGVEGIVADARAGKGTLGLVLSDEGLRQNIAEGVANFRYVSDVARNMARNVAEGKGLMGVLFNDPDIAAKVKAFLDQALMSLEDAREAAPLSSLGSFLFGSF